MQNGVRVGRKPKLPDFQRKEALARQCNGETLAQTARSYTVKHIAANRCPSADQQ
jgi:hypothetical protein